MRRLFLKRCMYPSCQRVFLTSDTEQRFCSRTCATREGWRSKPESRDLLRVQTLDDIEERLRYARRVHPHHADDLLGSLAAIREEVDELEQAIRHETPERVRDEALDVAVTVIRLLEGEAAKE